LTFLADSDAKPVVVAETDVISAGCIPAATSLISQCCADDPQITPSTDAVICWFESLPLASVSSSALKGVWTSI
jgi:hypothetical protein